MCSVTSHDTGERGPITQPSKSEVCSAFANGHAIEEKRNVWGGGQGAPSTRVCSGVGCRVPPGLCSLQGGIWRAGGDFGVPNESPGATVGS